MRVLCMGVLGRGSWIGELLMGFQRAAFLPCQASISTTFLNKCGRDESLGNATCL